MSEKTSTGQAHGVVAAKVRAPRLRWLPRERLDRQLDQLWQQRLCLVVAPAGSGKTTVLAGWASVATCPVGWYRAESTDGTEASFVACLEQAFAAAVPDLARGWKSVEDAVAILEARPEERVLLVIDDLHTLLGTPAEGAFERFLDYMPQSLAVVAGTRTPPAINLPRRRVSGEVLELSADDLRFRSWEVEQLFRDFYGEALRPDELARITRRTEGWAAGLQLFHLATRGKPPDERIRILAGLGSSSRFVREYLARNVVAELPEELRAFLVGTSVLRRLNGPLCDELLERTGSRALLEELERRCVFTVALDDEGNFRYHEVLRSHLETMLVELVGEARARQLAARAGDLLERAGALPESLAAYSRAEDWASVDRVIELHGERLVSGDGAWIDLLPPALLVQDPWLILATARRHRAEGRWAQAVDAYARAEALFPAGEGAALCRGERLALAAWLDPLPAPGTDWSGLLRSAVARDPLARRGGNAPSVMVPANGRRAVTVGDYLGSGFAALVAGRVREARRLLHDAAVSHEAGPTMAAAAGIGTALAGLLGGDARAALELEAAVAAADRIGAGWLARVGRAGVAAVGSDPRGVGGEAHGNNGHASNGHGSSRHAVGVPPGTSLGAGGRSGSGLGDAGPGDEGGASAQQAAVRAAAIRATAAIRDLAAHDEDRWGEGLAALAEGWAGMENPDQARPALEMAAGRFRSLGAATLEAWARALLAGSLARAQDADALAAARTAEAVARTAGAPGPHAIAHFALSLVDAAHADELRSMALAELSEIGLALPPALAGAGAPAGSGAAAVGTAGAGAGAATGNGMVFGAAPMHAAASGRAADGSVAGRPGTGTEGGAAPPDGTPVVSITCFGAFRMAVEGRPVDLAALKPRPRAVLRLLALNAGRPVHREVIQESLWPDGEADAGARSLHVALSQLRRELDPAGERAAAGGGVIVREGDAYRIVLSPRSRVDVLEFETAVADGRSARARGDSAGAIVAFRAALEAYGGDLLPEDGPADWVVPRRERTRADYVDVARALAELLVDAAPGDAASVCTAALAIDAYHDPLWRLLIAARERSGDVAAASAARAGYAKMLTELGVGAVPLA